MTAARPTRPSVDQLQERLARRLAADVAERAERVPHDIAERLRVAREQALLRARRQRQAEAQMVWPVRAADGAAVLGAAPAWWVRLGVWLPPAVLLGGLFLIGQVHEEAEIRAAAEVDAALLADDLPPVAFHDPGFVEFLKHPEP
ncbi:MAG: DUF3619 family protein [Burkholderiales bacterium]|nr:DUF3619 family protein [Burkholderiales bacterium]